MGGGDGAFVFAFLTFSSGFFLSHLLNSLPVSTPDSPHQPHAIRSALFSSSPRRPWGSPATPWPTALFAGPDP